MRILMVIRPYALLLLAGLSSLALLYPPAHSSWSLKQAIGALCLLVLCHTIARLRHAGVLGMTPGQFHAAQPTGLVGPLLLDAVVCTMGTIAISAMS